MYTCLVSHSGKKYNIKVSDNETVVSVIELGAANGRNSCIVYEGKNKTLKDVYMSKRISDVAVNHLRKRIVQVHSLQNELVSV